MSYLSRALFFARVLSLMRRLCLTVSRVCGVFRSTCVRIFSLLFECRAFFHRTRQSMQREAMGNTTITDKQNDMHPLQLSNRE